MKSREIRDKFLEFFKTKGHQIVPSSPMVIKDDPSLLFTNAGMNQFKSFFLGDTTPKHPKITNSQKCLRVSGKHNDLEEVGLDTYHHTMFEMLGNWSFGDYFKKEAIHWSWELLTEIYRLDKSRIYVTIFGGDIEDNLAVDQESYDLWAQLIDKDRIIKCDKKDNFWEMGVSGPCGPCSEIHIDLRDSSELDKFYGKDLVNKDHPQVIEVWNLVFMEYNRSADGKLNALSQKHIDTGMGLERLSMILQSKKSNYDTDIFIPLIQKVESLSSKKYNSNTSSNDKVTIAIRVIVDHIRAIAFSIADGQLPSNTGAGYVIRRILRRAVRYGYQSLELNEPFLHHLVPILASQFEGIFSELQLQKEFIQKVIKEEEVSFYRTMELGLNKIDVLCQTLKKAKKTEVSGADVFELYDRYGFPVDLTELIAKSYNFTLDKKGFETALSEQKNRSKHAAKADKSDWVIVREDDKEEFIGYDFTESDVFITRYREVNSKDNTFYHLVFNFTPFYPEGGGQVGDTGYIDNGKEKLSIADTKKENDLIIHISKDLPSNLTSSFRATINVSKRKLIANNHTATHLLHQALRDVLGKHVEQKGSLVNHKYLRFDFSHFEKLSSDQIIKIEELISSRIRENIPLEESRNIPLNKAKEQGATMLFGEKYGEVVRMIKFGQSVELCGGIHVESTSKVGNFIITGESSISAGVRRIEAITSTTADNYISNKLTTLESASQLLKNPANLTLAIEDLIHKNAQLVKQVEQFKRAAALNLKADLKKSIVKKNQLNVLIEKVDLDSSSVKDLCFQLKGEIESLVVVFGYEQKGKAMISVALSENIIAENQYNANNLVNQFAEEINGRGGGQAFFATAGGNNLDGLQAALEKARALFS